MSSHPTGQKKVPRHLSVSNASHIPQRLYTDHAVRRNLKLAVAINVVGGIFLKELTGTSYEGCPELPEYMDTKGKVLVSMGAEEYTAFIKAAWEHFRLNRDFRRKSVGALLVHDRATPHQSKAFKDWVKDV